MRITHPTDRPNFCRLDLMGLTVWFSYETPIAFRDDNGLVVRKNDSGTPSAVWYAEGGPTTGKHINYVKCAKDKQVSGSEFMLALHNALRNWRLSESDM